MCVQDLPRGTFVFLEQFHENLDNIVRLNSQQVFIICLENKFLEGNHFCRTTSLVPGVIILVKVEWMISPSLKEGQENSDWRAHCKDRKRKSKCIFR